MVISITLVKLAMSAISSLSSVSSGTGASSGTQAALQQAKRIADQAETTASALASQAANAEAKASDAEGYARSLSIQAGQAQLTVGYTQQNLSALETGNTIDSQISSVITNVVDAKPVKPSPGVVPVTPAVVNTQGQVTGKIINTSA